MKTIAAIALLAFSLFACGRNTLTTSPRMYVDADFNSDMTSVINAAHAWDGAGLKPEIVIVSHAWIVGAANENDSDNTIYIVATHTLEMNDCPGAGKNLVRAGETKKEPSNGAAISCVDVDYVHANPSLNHTDQMKRAVAHELGHAFGLPGSHPETEIMHEYYDGVDAPGCADFSNLVGSLPGAKLPAACE